MLLDGEVKYLSSVNKHLKQQEITAEVCLFGETLMYLVFGKWTTVENVAAVFVPTEKMKRIVKKVGVDYGLPEDWLAQAVNRFVLKHPQSKLISKMSNLTVYAASPPYVFSMKCLAAQMSGNPDVEDIKWLLWNLNIRSADAALNILQMYYPNSLILPKTRTLLEAWIP